MKQSTTLLLLAAITSLGWASNNAEAESIAKDYMIAFFHGELEAAARLMHPEALDEMQATILSEIERARTIGKADEFYRSLGLSPDIDVRRILQ